MAVGLDVGSSRSRCVICVLENGGIRYAGHGSATAAGWTRGRLVDQAALAGSIRAAVAEAEHRAQLTVDTVTLGVGGMEIRGAQSRGVYEFGRPRELTQEDLEYAAALASDVRLERDRMLLHVLPQDFTLDGHAGFRRPHKSLCSRLEAHVHIVTTAQHEHQALVAAAHMAHLAVEETVLEPMAAAYACMLPEDRAHGSALLDIGLHSCDLVIYDGEAMMLASSIPIWADHLTRDIAAIFKVSYEDAEELKQQYGCALLGLTAESSFIEIPSEDGLREARRSDLNEVLEARAEEMFQHVRGELERVNMERSLGQGIILSGGGALLNGMCDLAERVLDCQAANGIVMENDIGGWPEDLKSPLWTTAAGLALYSGKLKLHRPAPFKVGGLLGLVLK